jgi:PBSX family phage portal protein
MGLFSFGRKPAPAPGIEAFTFGELRNTSDYLDGILGSLFRTWHNGRYYEMPFNPRKIYDAQFVSPHHASAMQLKVNLLCDLFKPSRYLGLQEFRKFAPNAIMMGNGYLEEVPSKAGTAMGFRSSPAMYTRRMDDTQYGVMKQGNADLVEMKTKVVHYTDIDLDQEYYGKPYYLPAIAAANLNQQATKFRDLYYKNGNHAGFILYLSDPAHSLDDVKALKKALKESKGPGAFRNLFFYAPKGKANGMQVIPVESAQAQDKFVDIKNVSRDDVIAMHRVPPNLIAVQSTNAGGFGNILEAREAMIANEILPIAKVMMAVHPVLDFNLP